jgi:hypothetical protein
MPAADAGIRRIASDIPQFCSAALQLNTDLSI